MGADEVAKGIIKEELVLLIDAAEGKLPDLGEIFEVTKRCVGVSLETIKFLAKMVTMMRCEVEQNKEFGWTGDVGAIFALMTAYQKGFEDGRINSR